MLSFYLHCVDRVDRVDRVGRGFREVVLLAQSLVQIKVCDESFHFKMREAKHFGHLGISFWFRSSILKLK